MEMKEFVKETLSKWSAAVEYHTSRRYCEAVETYGEISDISARMYYNLACAYLKLDHTDFAIQCLCSAIEIDEHLAIAYFQRGTLYLLNKSIEKAIVDLETARMLLRGNTYIDYKPLGLHVILYSFQILHNLALAFAHVKKVAEARELLTEALTDADDLQGKSLQRSLERINSNQPSIISALQISVDKVFTPPKHVTQNLEKQGIQFKAKVVSASDTDDRSPGFQGSKRVRELKDMLKPPKTALNALKHFTLTSLSSDSKEKAANSGMKKSKSMNDLVTEDCSNTVICPRSPITRLKNIFKKKPSGPMEGQVSTGMRLNRSFGDLTSPVSPPVRSYGKIYSRTAFTGVRKLLNNKERRSNSETPGNEEMPVLVMRGCGSTGDLSKLGISLSGSEREGQQLGSPSILSKISSDFYEKLNFDSNRDTKSPGSDGYLTVVRHGKSLSCDVLTAIVTPTYGEEYVLADDTLNINIETQSGQTRKVLSDKAETQSSIQTETKVKAMTKTPLPIINAHDIIRDHRVKPDAKRQRPPPPSYPPPPLPPHMITKS